VTVVFMRNFSPRERRAAREIVLRNRAMMEKACMTTSEPKSKHSAPASSMLARAASFGPDTLQVELEDGRQITVPIGWFPRLAEALSTRRYQLRNWRLIGGGVGIHWPHLDEDISVENLLADRDELLDYRDAPADDGQHRPHKGGRVSRLRDPRTGRFEASTS
jgi:hypothetical protein